MFIWWAKNEMNFTLVYNTHLDHVIYRVIYMTTGAWAHQWSAWVKVTPSNDSGRYSEMSATPSSVPRKRTRIRPGNSLLSVDRFSVLSEVGPRDKQKHSVIHIHCIAI